MKEFRVDFPSGDTGRRTHRDFRTLEGAFKFMNEMGKDYCVLKKYDADTCCFEEVDEELLKAAQRLIG